MSKQRDGRVGEVASLQITAEDVLREGSPWSACEIWDGVPMVCEPSGGRAEVVGAHIVSELVQYVRTGDGRTRPLGWVVMSGQGFLLARDPDRLLAADGAFISRERLPLVPRRGFIEMAPDFLIEVRSPAQSWEQTIEKCGLWIAHGARCVWAIDPDAETVLVFRPGLEPEILRGTGRADAAPALPGFHLEIATLFEDLKG